MLGGGMPLVTKTAKTPVKMANNKDMVKLLRSDLEKLLSLLKS